MNKKILLWILVIFWMGLIFYFSSFNGIESTEQSQGFLSRTIRDSDNKNDLILKLDPIIRKCAHCIIYSVLSILVYLLLKEYNLDVKKLILFTFLICILYSISDEVHQLFVSGRSAEVRDVIIDGIGITIGILVLRIKDSLFLKN